MKYTNLVLAALLGFTTLSAQADVASAEKMEKLYTTIAKSVTPDYAGPNADDGKEFYNRKITQFKGKTKDSQEVACASCHTANPADKGKHIVTGKAIKPLSPVVNAKRFSDLDKVEDKFTKHCNEIIGADCKPEEKANFIAYLLTESTPSAKK